MNVNYTKIAASISAVYVLFFFGGIFVHYFNTGDAYTLKYSLMLPTVWIAATLGLVIAWGLWKKFLWAWWLGLVSVLFQLIAHIRHMLKFISLDLPLTFGILAVFVMLVSFLFLILLPQTKKQCTR